MPFSTSHNLYVALCCMDLLYLLCPPPHTPTHPPSYAFLLFLLLLQPSTLLGSFLLAAGVFALWILLQAGMETRMFIEGGQVAAPPLFLGEDKLRGGGGWFAICSNDELIVRQTAWTYWKYKSKYSTQTECCLNSWSRQSLIITAVNPSIRMVDCIRAINSLCLISFSLYYPNWAIRQLCCLVFVFFLVFSF